MNYYPIFGKNYRAFRVVVLLIYAIDKIFTRPPVAAVAPNINSGLAASRNASQLGDFETILEYE